jgi:hypothetical protein
MSENSAFDANAFLSQFSDSFQTLPPEENKEQLLVEEDPYGKEDVKTIPESYFFGASLPEQEAPEEPPAADPLVSFEPSDEPVFEPVSFIKQFKTDFEPFPETTIEPVETPAKATVEEPQPPEVGFDEPLVVETTPVKIEQFYQGNPRINLMLNSIKEAKKQDKDERVSDVLYNYLGNLIIEESLLPDRPMDEEIRKSIQETASGMTKAVRQKSGFSAAIEFETGSSPLGFDPFDTGISEVADITNEQYQDRLAQEIAMKAGLDFSRLNKALRSQREISEEKSVKDLTIDTRYGGSEAQEIAADLLNIPLGLATMAYGATYSGFESQQTGAPGELLDFGSKLAYNVTDFVDLKEALEEKEDIIGIDENLNRISSGAQPVTRFHSLNRIVSRGEKNSIADTDVYVPTLLHSDVINIMGSEDEWKKRAIPLIVENINSSFDNKEIDVPVSSRTIFETGEPSPADKASVVADMLFAASFSGNVKESMDKFYPLVKGVPLPTEGNTLGRSVARTLDSAMSYLDVGSVGRARQRGAGTRATFVGEKDKPKSIDFKEVFGTATREEVEGYSDEKIDSILSSYIQEKTVKELGKQIDKGLLGPSFYKKDDSKKEKEFKRVAGAAVILADYYTIRPEFTSTREEYFARLGQGLAGVPDDILLSFIAVDVAINGYDPKKSNYSPSQVEAARKKLDDDFAYVVLDLAMFSSIAGTAAKAGILTQRALPKAVRQVLDARGLRPKQSFIKNTVQTLQEITEQTKINIQAERIKIRNKSEKPIDREDVQLFMDDGSFTVFKAVFDEKPTPIKIQRQIREIDQKIAKIEKDPSTSGQDLKIAYAEKKSLSDQLAVLKAYYMDEFESFIARPGSREPGPVSFSISEGIENYRTVKKGTKVEKKRFDDYNKIQKNVPKKERIAAETRAQNAITTLVRVAYPGMDAFAPGNAAKVIKTLQANGVTDPGIYKRFFKKTRDPEFSGKEGLTPKLIAEVKHALRREGGKEVGKIVNSLFSKKELARMKNKKLDEMIDQEQSVSIAAEASASGITNPFFYGRLPGLTNKQINYFIGEARKSLKNPKDVNSILVRNVDDGLTIYKRDDVIKKPKVPIGLRKSTYNSAWGISFDSTSRLFFGDRAISLARNKDYTYAFAEFMSRPLAFFNMPRQMQNFMSEMYLFQLTTGQTDTMFHAFLDTLITKENRLGSPMYYDLLALTARKDIDMRQFSRLLKEIPGAEDFVVNMNRARSLFKNQDLAVDDFARVDALSFDYIVQSMMTKDSVAIRVNNQNIIINDLLELQVNQTGKLKQDIVKLNKRIAKLKDGPLKQRLQAQANAAKRKIDSGDVYVSVDEVYGSLPKIRQRLSEVEEKLLSNPTSQSLLAEKKALNAEVRSLAALTPEEVLSGVTDLRWEPKKSFSEMNSTEKTLYYAAQEVVLPLQEKIYNVVAQIMSAEDTVILAQKSRSNAPANIVVEITDKGYKPVKIFDNSSEGADIAFEFSQKLNQRAKQETIPTPFDVAENAQLFRQTADDLADVPGDPKFERVADETPAFKYRTISADELAVNGQNGGIPIVKRAMGTPASELIPMLARYMSVYVDGAALKMAARELFDASVKQGPKNQQAMVDSFARKMLYAFDNGSEMVSRYGSPSKALEAILEMDELDQVASLGRALLPQERFYANQAFGSVMTPAELLSVTANSRFRLRNTYVGLLTNLEQYRIMNRARVEGGLITPSEYGLLDSRMKNRYVALSNVYPKSPGWGILDPIFDKSASAAKKAYDEFQGTYNDGIQVRNLIGDYGKTDPVFGNKHNLFISREVATHLSDFAGLVNLSQQASTKALSLFKKGKVFNLTNGIIPIQLISSVFYHGYLLTKHPKTLLNYWMFDDGPSVFLDVVRVKSGLKPKNPKVEEAARRGTISVSADFDLNPAGINDTLFMVDMLAASADVFDDLSQNTIGKFVQKLEDVYNGAPAASKAFVDRMKISVNTEARKPIRATVGLPEKPYSRLRKGANSVLSATNTVVDNIQFTYSLFDEWLKTLNSLALNKAGMSMDQAVPNSINSWFNYGNLSRNSDAMRYGILSPFSSPFMGYLANSFYAFPGLFADAPLRAGIAGHALNIHNQAAIETIKMYNEIAEMRIAMGDVMTFALPTTDVEVGKMRQSFGPDTINLGEMASFGQTAGTMRRIDPSGFSNLLSFSATRSPDTPITEQIASGKLVDSPLARPLLNAGEMVTGMFSEESKFNAREKEFNNEKKALEKQVNALEQAIEMAKDKGIEPSPKDIERLSEIQDYLDYVIQNDLRITPGTKFYNFAKNLLPTQLFDIFEMFPNFTSISVAPDRDPTRLSDYFGIKLAPADITKVISSNIVSKKDLNKLNSLYEKMVIEQTMSDVSDETKAIYEKDVEKVLKQIEEQTSKPDVLKKLSEQKLRAINNYKAAVFSLYLTGKVDTFLQERYKQGRSPFYYLK